MSAETTEAAATPSRQVWLDRGRQALIVLVVAAAVWAVARQWQAVRTTIATIDTVQLLLALGATLAGVYLGMLSWRTVMVGIARPAPGSRIAPVYLVGQMGKYLPGSVWAVVLQMEIGRKAGLARAQVFVAALVSTGVSIAASLFMGMLAVPQLAVTHPWLRWAYVGLPFLLAAMHPRVVTMACNLVLRVVRRPPLSRPVTARSIVGAFLLAVAMYAMYGIQIWLLVKSRGGIGIENAAFLTGGLSLGMTVGVLAFVLPSGLGAREAVLLAALGAVMPDGPALAFAVVSRVMFTVAELVTMAIALVPEMSTLRAAISARRPAAPESSGPDE